MISTVYYSTNQVVKFEFYLDITKNTKNYLQEQTQKQMIGNSSLQFLNDFFEDKNEFLNLFILYQFDKNNKDNKDEKTAIGYALYHLIENDFVNECELLTILIGEEFQNQKYGQKLLQESLIQLQEQKNVNQCLLEVRKSNISAIKCYEKTGFKTIHTRKKYYPATTNRDSEDALIMELNF